MITKRDVAIVFLTFCLTATLFTILPAGSNYKTSGIGEYDPWLDSNEDGRINILECITLANSFGTTGDPAKNVNVINWPSESNASITNWPSELNTNVTNWPVESNVSVTNLPLEYNSTITNWQPKSKVITVVEDLNITWDFAIGYSGLINVSTVFVGDYSRAKIYFKVTNCTNPGGSPNSNIVSFFVYIYRVYDYGECTGTSAMVQWSNTYDGTPLFATNPDIGGEMNIVDSPCYRLAIATSSTNAFTPRPDYISCLLSIGIYLRNE